MGDHDSEMDEREAAIRSAADHAERTRKRIDEGKAEMIRRIDRRESISSLFQRSVDREASDYDDAA